MEEKEVQVQVFNDGEYFIYDSINIKDDLYVIFAKVNNPEQILIVKEVTEDEDSYYEELTPEESDYVMSQYYQQNQ